MPAAFCDDPGWVLTQRSSTMGDQYVYLSAAGCKLVNPKVGFALVTRAPNWDITLYNDSTKCYYETTLEKWKRDMEARGLTAGNILKGTWKKGGSGNVGGTNATQYVMGANSGTYLDGTGKKKMTSVDGAQYWVADDIKVPPTLVDLIAVAYGLPKSPKVPLRLKISAKHGDTQLLDTYRTQTAPIPVSYFVRPQGYKQVQTDAEVMMNDEQKQILQEMGKELGSSPDAPPPPTPGLGSVQTPAGGTAGGGAKVSQDDINRLLNALKKGGR